MVELDPGISQAAYSNDPLALTEYEAAVVAMWEEQDALAGEAAIVTAEEDQISPSITLGRLAGGVAAAVAGLAANAAPSLAQQPEQVVAPAAKSAEPFNFAASTPIAIEKTPYSARISAVAGSMATESVSTLTPEEEQQCVDTAIAAPTFRNAVMKNAGIRPFTPHKYWHVEGASVTYDMLSIPDGSEPGMPNCSSTHRLITQKLQMQKPHHRGTWLTLDKFGPNYLPNPEGQPTIHGQYSWGPAHAWPSWVFNQCTDGKGWLKVKYTQTLEAKNAETGAIEGEASSTVPLKVTGNCAAAARSARLAKNAQQQWNG